MNEDTYHLGIKALVRNKEGKYLLLKVNEKELVGNTHGVYWDIPGGRVKRGDSIEATLAKEVLEETGIKDVKVVRELGTALSNIRIPLKEGGDVGLILSVYEVESPSEQEVVLSNEHTEYGYFDKEKVQELLSVKYPKNLIDKLFT